MRYLKLSISFILIAIGLAAYFITVPQIDEDELVNLTVQAGDEAILDNYDFDGYLSHFSSFRLSDDEIVMPTTLSFLERMDASDDVAVMLLQKDHADFTDPLVFGRNIFSYMFSNGKTNLTSAHFSFDDGSYSKLYSSLILRTLDKTSDNIEEELITRKIGANIYYASIVGIYENYPEIDVLIDTRYGTPPNEEDETTQLSLLSYNFKTKNMTETVLLETKDYLEPEHYHSVFSNQSLLSFSVFDAETSVKNSYLIDFETDTISLRDDSSKRFIISDDSRLYSIEESTLVAYDETLLNGISEVTLSTDFAEKKTINFSTDGLYILDDKLFVVNNKYQDEYANTQTDQMRPTDIVVYDLTTGEILVEAQANFDGIEQVGASAGSIDLIKEKSTKD